MPAIKNTFHCPICGAKTKVLRTRSATSTRLIRYRICTAGHRTTTREVVDSDLNSPRSMVDRTLLTIALQNLSDELGITLTSDLRSSSNTENPFHGDQHNDIRN